MFTRSTYDSLRVLIYWGTVVLFLGVLPLCFHEPATNRNSIQFVRADPASQDFITAGLGIKQPLILSLDDRNRHREIVVPHHQDNAIQELGVGGHSHFFLRLSRKRGCSLFI